MNHNLPKRQKKGRFGEKVAKLRRKEGTMVEIPSGEEEGRSFAASESDGGEVRGSDWVVGGGSVLNA